MALELKQIRALADRVAASYGLEVVDVIFEGSGKHRTLRVAIEKGAEERARLVARARELQAMAAQSAPDAAGLTEQDREWLEALPGVRSLELLSGITHEDCERFSQDFGTVLDVEELVAGTEYLLEVSSPGLDRRLTRLEEFARFQDCLAKLQLFEPVGGSRRWQARIAGVGEGRVRLTTEAKRAPRGAKAAARPEAGGEIEIAFSNIERANLVAEF